MVSDKTGYGVHTCAPRESQAVNAHCTVVWCSGMAVEGSGGGSRCAKNGLGLAFNPFKVMQHPSLLLLRLASTFSYLEKELI